MTRATVLMALVLTASGCAGRRPERPPEYRDGLLVLDSIPHGAIVIGTLVHRSPTYTSGIMPLAMDAAIRHAARMGADAVLIEQDKIVGNESVARVKAVRIHP